MALSAFGGVTFVVYREFLVVYYEKFHVSPEQVGLDYPTLLRTQAISAVWVILGLTIVTMAVFQRRRSLTNAEIAELKLELADAVGDPVRVALINKHVIRIRRDLNKGVGIAALIIGLGLAVWVSAFAYLAVSAPIGPRSPSIFDPLQVRVVQVTVEWQESSGGHIFGSLISNAELRLCGNGNGDPHFLLLGDYAGKDVLYDETCHEPVTLDDRDLIVVGG